MGRGQRIVGRDLPPEHVTAATFLHKSMLNWRSKDPMERSVLSDTIIVDMIEKKTGVKIPRSTLSSWKSGVRIPSPEYIEPLSVFFEVDPFEMAEAFGHEYVPPMSFREFYRQIEIAIEEWKDGKRPNEDWKMHSRILEGLALYFNDEWMAAATRDEDGELDGWIPVAETVLRSDIPLVLKAHQLLFLAEAEENQRYVVAHKDEYLPEQPKERQKKKDR